LPYDVEDFCAPAFPRGQPKEPPEGGNLTQLNDWGGTMDAHVFDKNKLPSRHVTEGPARAPHRSLSDMELAERRKRWKPRPTDYGSGAIWKYAQAVGSAKDGAVTHPGFAGETHVYADS